MIKIDRDQCPDYERMADMCALPPTRKDLADLAKKAGVPLKTLEDAVHVAETGQGKRKGKGKSKSKAKRKSKAKKSNKAGRGRERTARTQAAAVLIVTLVAAGVTYASISPVHYYLLLTGVLKEYCGLGTMSRIANDLIAREIGGRMTCQGIEQHNRTVIYGLWTAVAAAGVSVGYIKGNFWSAVRKVEDILIGKSHEKKTKKKKSSSHHSSKSSSESPRGAAAAMHRTKKKRAHRRSTSSSSSSDSSTSKKSSTSSRERQERMETALLRLLQTTNAPESKYKDIGSLEGLASTTSRLSRKLQKSKKKPAQRVSSDKSSSDGEAAESPVPSPKKEAEPVGRSTRSRRRR
tara:strand:+ start:440 stop:1486 length:1047 start_codon:yes stop_codon:yes gene_type:complete